MAKPRRHAKPKARKKTTSKRPRLVYRDKPKRTTGEARDLIRELLDNVAESPENVEVARDLAFENEILDYKMLFDIAADLKLDPVAIGNAEWSGTDMWDQSTVDFKLDGIEYKAVETEDVAEKIALASVTQDLKDEPEIFNQDFIQHHINMEKLRAHLRHGDGRRLRRRARGRDRSTTSGNLAERIAGLTASPSQTKMEKIAIRPTTRSRGQARPRRRDRLRPARAPLGHVVEDPLAATRSTS
jgi:hypothetical protein